MSDQDPLTTLERLLKEERTAKKVYLATRDAEDWRRLCEAQTNCVPHLFSLAPALLEVVKALTEIMDYSGGADHALDDEYVVDRARAALRALEVTK